MSYEYVARRPMNREQRNAVRSHLHALSTVVLLCESADTMTLAYKSERPGTVDILVDVSNGVYIAVHSGTARQRDDFVRELRQILERVGYPDSLELE